MLAGASLGGKARLGRRSGLCRPKWKPSKQMAILLRAEAGSPAEILLSVLAAVEGARAGIINLQNYVNYM